MSEDTLLREAQNKGVSVIRTVLGVGGILAIVAGLLIMLNPVSSAQTVAVVVAIFFAIYLIVAGIGFLGGAIFSTTTSGWGRVGYGVLGVLYVLGAIFAFGNLNSLALVLVAFLAIFVGVTWILEGVISFVALSNSTNKVWDVIYGIISIIAGIALAFWPLSGGLALWWLLGVMLVAMGLIQAISAFFIKKS